MSPMSQFAAVATLTFAVLGFQTVALILLGVTLVLLLIGFISGLTAAPAAPDPEGEGALVDG